MHTEEVIISTEDAESIITPLLAEANIEVNGDNISKSSTDAWANKYIFPNGMLPSTAQLATAMEGLFVTADWHNIGPHDDKTLHHDPPGYTAAGLQVILTS
ncbi:MAG: hypothetical protein HPY76_00520 [Anaerolineae bacterium]|nr:hypothetical protein [Anaerolineae bacterium]